MKKFWPNLGRAFLYLLLFLGIKTAVELPIMFVEGFKMGAEAARTGKEINMEDAANHIASVAGSSVYLMILIASVLTIAVLVIMFTIRKKDILNETQTQKFSLKFIAPVVLIGLAVQVLLSALVNALPIAENFIESFSKYVGMMTSEINVISILTIGVLVPITEEVIFRGLIFSRLRRGMPVFAALILQAVFFSILHTGIVWMLQAFIMGLIFGLIAHRFASILPAILVHMAINISGVLLSVLAPDWGKAAYYIVLAVSVVVFISMMFIVLKFGGGKKKTEQVQAGV